ncbi:hypothetical protein [Nocardioides marmoraquaticus]
MMLTIASRRAAALVLALLAPLLLVGGPVRAADVDLDPALLPQGAAPALPHLDQERRVIVDGSRRVSLAGLVGTPLWFVKVKGGYLLDRGRDDVVRVTTSGARSVLTYRRTSDYDGAPALAVSSGGDKVALSISDPRPDGSATYRETRVLDAVTGRVLARRSFSPSDGQVPVAFGTQRVLLGNVWWSFAGNRVERFRTTVVAAHLASWRGFGFDVDPAPGGEPRSGELFTLPPDGGNPTAIAPPDTGRRVFSVAGTHLGGPATLDESSGTTDRVVVHDARHGVVLLDVTGVDAAPVVTWETDGTVLFLARRAGGGPDALVRCTVAGECERAGPLEQGDVEGPYRSNYRLLPVSRRDG